MTEIDWDADDVKRQIMTASKISDMETATTQLIDTVQCINRWVDDHPEHDQLSVWSRELLEAVMYIQGEYVHSQELNHQHLQEKIDQFESCE
ncbi:hypothetical protein [Haladaptatus halobius]|uniref:hypothetical protein n=1 Tax=Haladaptatus halobius TaxID=2884875 RepID=UPI001D0ABDAE|nr:hypothetical protein [Haladaptatus halobius]